MHVPTFRSREWGMRELALIKVDRKDACAHGERERVVACPARLLPGQVLFYGLSIIQGGVLFIRLIPRVLQFRGGRGRAMRKSLLGSPASALLPPRGTLPSPHRRDRRCTTRARGALAAGIDGAVGAGLTEGSLTAVLGLANRVVVGRTVGRGQFRRMSPKRGVSPWAFPQPQWLSC